MVKAQPVNPIDRFNSRFPGNRQKKNNGHSADTSGSDDTTQKKDEQKKKNNSTNDLSQLGELLRENEEQQGMQDEKKGDNEMADKKITSDMREGLNALGIDDDTINGLSFNDAVDILKDKEYLAKELDNITDNQKITQDMREGLNALGMDDDTINGLSFNDALGILKDRAEISEKLDDLNIKKEPEEIKFHEGNPLPAPKPHENLDWIDEKVRDYNQMKDAGNTDIKSIVPDKVAQTFTAEVDNGTITYTSENDVTITKDSSYKVFDTVMKEPSNAGKAIRIPEDASKEFKTNLFIAAVLNNHKVNGAEGLELDEATMQKLNLTEEQKAKILAALPKKEEKTEEKPAEEKTEEKPAEEKTVEISKSVQDAIAKMNETKQKLAKMIEEGKVTASLNSNPETKKSEISFNFDSTKGGTEADAAEANKLLSEAIKSVGALRQNTIPEDKDAAAQVVTDNYAIKSAQLDLIRSVYQPEPNEAVKAMDRIRAKKLGLTDEPVYKYVRDKEGHLIRNKKGDLVEDKYKRDEAGNFAKDEKGRRIVDESKQVQTLEGEKLAGYQSKLSAGIMARVKAGNTKSNS